MSVINQVAADTQARHICFLTFGIFPQEEQRVVLDEQVLDKQKAKLQLQQDKVQDAQDLAAALKQHKIDEAKAAAARRSAALQTKALMAGQVGQTHHHVFTFLYHSHLLVHHFHLFMYSYPSYALMILVLLLNENTLLTECFNSHVTNVLFGRGGGP